MFDLTGMSLAAYLLRVVKSAVNRNPRFRRSLGDVAAISSNRISFGNVQVLVRDVTSDNARLSFDYFVSTLTGRAVLAKLREKDGLFFEWATETDATGQTPPAGVYYFNVDHVDEGTGEVLLTLQTYRWYEGSIRNAAGTLVAFRSGIEPSTVTLTDPTATGAVPTLQTPAGLYLLTKLGGLTAHQGSGTLTPNTDYWIQATQTETVLASTIFGQQTATIPPQFTSFDLVDQDGYVLRPLQDYSWVKTNEVVLAPWTPAGQTISVTGTVQLDPTVVSNLMGPENTLAFSVGVTEALATKEAFVATQDGNNIALIPGPTGAITLPAPLPPGGWCVWDVRVLVGQSQLTAHKNAVNRDLLPGLRIAVGDQVVENDQCVILVSKEPTQTYRVYGGQPNITFTLDVKANDPTTADELGKMLKAELVHWRKENLEADGLHIFDVTTATPMGSQRDLSGTAPTYTISLSFTGQADWRMFEPLVTRLMNWNVTALPYVGTFQSGPQTTPRYSCLQATGFIPDYR